MLPLHSLHFGMPPGLSTPESAAARGDVPPSEQQRRNESAPSAQGSGTLYRAFCSWAVHCDCVVTSLPATTIGDDNNGDHSHEDADDDEDDDDLPSDGTSDADRYDDKDVKTASDMRMMIV